MFTVYVQFVLVLQRTLQVSAIRVIYVDLRIRNSICRTVTALTLLKLSCYLWHRTKTGRAERDIVWVHFQPRFLGLLYPSYGYNSRRRVAVFAVQDVLVTEKHSPALLEYQWFSFALDPSYHRHWPRTRAQLHTAYWVLCLYMKDYYVCCWFMK